MATDDPNEGRMFGSQFNVVPGGAGGYPFVGIPSFMSVPICTDLDKLDADIAIMGAPTDEGSPFLPGARLGTRSIREHSMRFGNAGYYDHNVQKEFLADELQGRRIVDVGDANVQVTQPDVTFDNITALTKAVVDRGAMPVVIGGDHAISFPIARAFNEPFHVVHFDAHIDYVPFWHGFQYTNGHAFRLIRTLDNCRSMTQVGIRSLRNAKSWIEDALADGNRVINMQQFRDEKPSGIVGGIPRDSKIYVSIDVDVLDNTLVPGCVSAEPDGMMYNELRDTLFALAEHTEIIGFDLCEVNPQLDVRTGVTSYLAAHTIIEFLSRICDQPRWAKRKEARQSAKESSG